MANSNLKHLILKLGLVAWATSNCLACDAQDSTLVNIERTNKIIGDLKDKLAPANYHLDDAHFDATDISFSYPEKTLVGDRFYIEVKWKGNTIFEYEVDTTTYSLTGAVNNLR